MDSTLPVFGIRSAFAAAQTRGPVVLSSPTGSGKSTEVPRWCHGKVLVVEPRRIACRTLAARVAELEGTPLGQGVGYVVRDERMLCEQTRILFATPGMVLRDKSLLRVADTVILDEFHERSLDLDLLLALLLRTPVSSLVIMSATLDAERVASHVGGVHLRAEGQSHPVDIRYLGDSPAARPDAQDLPARVQKALDLALHEPGDVLVFLPGKAEIEACSRALGGARGGAFQVLPLHGGLALDEQRRAFAPSSRRKLILATNVAETALTIVGIGVVIDAGLVRQTRYQAGRGFLALVPIAEDSATQRAGRAGRTAAGVCFRLWGARAQLDKATLPELLRESLVPLVLGAAAFGTTPEQLSWLDAPKPYALEAARSDLAAWGALEASGALSEQGRGLLELPLEASHARLLLSARSEGCLEDMIDLVSVLSVGRPLFVAAAKAGDGMDDDFRAAGCDVLASLRALRSSAPDDPRCSGFVLREAHAARARLRRLEGLPASSHDSRADAKIDREALVRAAIAADPRLVHVARTRGRDIYFSNGGTEIELARESALQNQRDVQALVVLDTRAFGLGREARVLVTCGMAIPLSAIARAGLGRDQLASVQLTHGKVVCSIERVYAKRVIATREDTPEGALLREALATLLERGSLFKQAIHSTRERLGRLALASAVAARTVPQASGAESVPALRDWLLARLETLGVESAEDMQLLSASDLLADELAPEVAAALERDFPRHVSVGDALYRADYDLTQNEVLLVLIKGTRREPPPLIYLPRFVGLRVSVKGPGGAAVLRAR